MLSLRTSSSISTALTVPRANAKPHSRASSEREFRLLKGIAEGIYHTKHAEAARLYYTTILLFYYTTTLALKASDCSRQLPPKKTKCDHFFLRTVSRLLDVFSNAVRHCRRLPHGAARPRRDVRSAARGGSRAPCNVRAARADTRAGRGALAGEELSRCAAAPR